MKNKFITIDHEGQKRLEFLATAQEYIVRKSSYRWRSSSELLIISASWAWSIAAVMPFVYVLANPATLKAVKHCPVDSDKPKFSFRFSDNELVDFAIVSRRMIHSALMRLSWKISALFKQRQFSRLMFDVRDSYDRPPILDEANVLALKAKLNHGGYMNPTSSAVKYIASAMESPKTSDGKRLRVGDAEDAE